VKQRQAIIQLCGAKPLHSVMATPPGHNRGPGSGSQSDGVVDLSLQFLRIDQARPPAGSTFQPIVPDLEEETIVIVTSSPSLADALLGS
jgi:hypothetical protein